MYILLCHFLCAPLADVQWTVPQLSIMIIYNSTWSILIQKIRIILSGDNLTQKTQKKDPFTSLHKIKANLPHWAEFEVLRNGALLVLRHTYRFITKFPLSQLPHVPCRRGTHWDRAWVCLLLQDAIEPRSRRTVMPDTLICLIRWPVKFRYYWKFHGARTAFRRAIGVKWHRPA